MHQGEALNRKVFSIILLIKLNPLNNIESRLRSGKFSSLNYFNNQKTSFYAKYNKVSKTSQYMEYCLIFYCKICVLETIIEFDQSESLYLIEIEFS